MFGAAVLAELPIEVSAGIAVIQRRLRLAIASANGAVGASQEVRKWLVFIARSSAFIDSNQCKDLLKDQVVQQRAVASADPALEL